MRLIYRLLPVILGLIALGACTRPTDAEVTDPNSALPPETAEPLTEPTPTLAQTTDSEELPDEITSKIETMLLAETGDTLLQLGRYSRETWTDGCLGLGGPAEGCLFALTEGWQVEMIDTTTGESYFYRTDLSGNSIRRSTLNHNFPPSVRDRVFQTVVSNGWANNEDLVVTTAEPQMWDGCYGIPPADGVCPEVGIMGWRAVVSDGSQSWVYHTDNRGDEIHLKE